MRTPDPALEEIWTVREQIAAEHGFDIDALYARYVALEAEAMKEREGGGRAEAATSEPPEAG